MFPSCLFSLAKRDFIFVYIYISYFIYWSYFIPKSVFFGGADGLTHWDSTPSPPLRCQRWSARHPGIGQKLWSTCSSCCSWGPLTPSLLGFVAGSSGRVHLEKVKVKQGKSGLNSTFPSHSSAFDWVGIQLVSFGFERNLVTLDCIIFHSLPGLWHCDLENSWERWGLVAVGISGVSDVSLWTLKGRWWDAPKKAPRLFVCHPLLLVCVCVCGKPWIKGYQQGGNSPSSYVAQRSYGRCGGRVHGRMNLYLLSVWDPANPRTGLPFIMSCHAFSRVGSKVVLHTWWPHVTIHFIPFHLLPSGCIQVCLFMRPHLW